MEGGRKKPYKDDPHDNKARCITSEGISCMQGCVRIPPSAAVRLDFFAAGRKTPTPSLLALFFCPAAVCVCVCVCVSE